MTFTAQDIQNKIEELIADDAPFALRNFDIDGELHKGFINAPADMIQLLQPRR